MRSSKNVCLNVQNAKPPANSVTEVTPEKELDELVLNSIQKLQLKKAGKNHSSSPHQSNTTTAYNRKKGRNNEVYIKIDDDDDECNNNEIEEYSAIEDENHPTFGANGFLNGERFTHGDRLPLINNNVQESKAVPPNLELQQQLILSSGSANTSDGIQRSSSNTTITTTSTTGDAPKQRFAVTDTDFGDEEEEVAERRAQKEDELMDFVGADNPVYEKNISDLLVGGTSQPVLRSQSQLAEFLNQSQPRQLMDTMGQIFGGGIGKENQFLQIGSGVAKTIQANNTTIGTNTMSIPGYNNNNRNIEGGRISYYPQSDMENKTSTYEVSINDRKQKAAEKRRKQRLKQLSREQAQIIKPQEQPGYVGDKDVSDILMLFEINDRNHKSNSPSATRGGTLENSNGKKANKKQKPKPQRISQNGKKGQQFGGNRQESYASPEDEEEEMDVDIELDKENGNNNNLMEEKPQLALNGGKQQRHDQDPIAIEMSGDNILGPTADKETMKETVEEQESEKKLPTLGEDDKWESPVVKKTQKALEEQKRKMAEEMAKKKKSEEEENKRKKVEMEQKERKKAEMEERERKKAEMEKERKKAENEERKKKQKEERKKKEEERKKKEEERKRMEEEEKMKKLEAEKKEKQRKEMEEAKKEQKKNEEEAIQKEKEEENVDEGEQKSEQAKAEENEMKDKKQSGKKSEGGGAWCSASLAAKKQKFKQEQQKIRQTPLLDRIPPNVLAQLRWKNPITIELIDGKLNVIHSNKKP